MSQTFLASRQLRHTQLTASVYTFSQLGVIAPGLSPLTLMPGSSKGHPPIRGKGGPAMVPSNTGWARPRPTLPRQQQDPHPLTQMRHASYAGAAGAAASNVEREAYRALAEATKDKRNLLILKTPKHPTDSGPRKKLLEQVDWAELIFDLCEIKPDDVAGIDFQAGGFNAAEIQLKDEVDSSQYVGISKELKGMTFNISKSQENSTRITFKNVPLSVPDQELLHLVKAYGGKLEKEEVEHAKEQVSSPKGINLEVMGTTRFIHATFPPNKRLKSFYWLQGPLSKDPLRRIIAEHAGQVGRQCGHCLRGSADPVNPCHFNGKTSACKKNNPLGRQPLSRYFSLLREEDHYVSLKHQYMWSQQDEDLTNQQFSDDFVGEEEGENEQGLTAKPPTKYSSWAEEMNALRSKVEEKEDKLKKEKEQMRKVRNDLRRSRADTVDLRREISINHQCSRQWIAEKIANEEELEKNFEFVVAALANSLPTKDFELKDDVVGPKPGASPWKDFEKLIDDLVVRPKNELLTKLYESTHSKMKDRLLNKHHGARSRSPSISRNREEASEDELEENEAKSAKFDDSESVTKNEAGQHEGHPGPQNGSQ